MAEPRKPVTYNQPPVTCFFNIIANSRTRKHVVTRSYAPMQATKTFVMIVVSPSLTTNDPIGSTREPQGPFPERLPLRTRRAGAGMDHATGRALPARVPRGTRQAQFP